VIVILLAKVTLQLKQNRAGEETENFMGPLTAQVGGGALERIMNAFEVRVRIILTTRVPNHFFVEDDLAADEGGAFPASAAEVE
jgi:hypothetical protein